MMDRVATGETSAAVSLEQFLHQEQSQAMARMKRPGAYTARLLAAGPAWLLPDLVQNIRDRPLPEVMDFLCRLHDLPTRPTTESLRAVFSWYDDGFLGGLPYEDDPVAAWAACAPPPFACYTVLFHLLFLHGCCVESPGPQRGVSVASALTGRQYGLRRSVAQEEHTRRPRGAG